MGVEIIFGFMSGTVHTRVKVCRMNLEMSRLVE